LPSGKKNPTLKWSSFVHKKNLIIKVNIRPNKIKVLVLRQRRPLKIAADRTFVLPYRKKIAAAPYF
jgi:hypothetical protein